jgi:hypothetical protein
MTTAELPLQPDQEVTSLRVHRAGQVDPVAVCRALREAAWLGERVESDVVPPGITRYLTDLVLPLPPDGRLLSLHKAAYVDLGAPITGPDGSCVVDIAWRSASLAPLFPVFAGRLVANAGGLAVEGNYAPPGGLVGRAADRMLLHVAARGTARWFLSHLASTIRS